MADIRVGVVGLSNAGKTVFLTSVIYNLLTTANQYLDKIAKRNLVLIGCECPLPDGTESFPYEENLACYRHKPPSWPPRRTRDVTEFKLNLEVTKNGTFKRRHTLTFVDYPGENLLDLCLLDAPYHGWSSALLRRLSAFDGPRKLAGDEYLAAVQAACTQSPAVADSFAVVCQAYQKLCETLCRDGLHLPPTKRATDSLVPPFCPLPAAVRTQAPGIAKMMEQAFERYKRTTVAPFLKRIGRCTHQVVLVDVLDILRARQARRYNQAVEDMGAIMGHFKFLAMRENPLSKLVGGLWDRLPFRAPRIRKVVFCCTKADQAGVATRPNLRGLLKTLTKKAEQRIQFAGLKGRVKYHYCAASCSTTPDKREHQGQKCSVLIGRLVGGNSEMDEAWYPGEVPVEWPKNDAEWEDCRFPDFMPRPLPPLDGTELPHVNLDLVLFDLLEEYLK